MNRLRRLFAVIFICMMCSFSVNALADSSGGIGTNQTGEVATGLNQATTKINTLLSSVITSAVSLSSSLKTQADGFAGALGVITIILACLRFSAAHHPVAAWVSLFEELGMLGIFAALYIGYTGVAPAFYNSFTTMAGEIAPDINGQFGAFGATAATFWDGFTTALAAASWMDKLGVILNSGPIIGAFVVMMVTSIVMTFYTHLGQIQSSVGIVMGQVAFALGFSSYTRSYFVSWLNYMISAGMYIVIAGILVSLVGKSIASALSTASGAYLTNQGASLVLDLSLFVLLLAFEIPKMANMFTGGGNVSGSAFKTLTKTVTGGLL